MATTVQSFLNESRYDNRDFTKHDYDDPQLLVYLNRVLRVLSHELSQRRSSDVFTTQALTQTDGNIFIDISAYSVIVIREMWRSQNFVYKKPIEWICRQRQVLDASATPSGTPYNWAHDDFNQYIAFDYENNSGSGITFTAHWDLYPTALTLNGNMPFGDKYNNFMREALLVFSKKSKKDKIGQTDVIFQEMFRAKFQREVLIKRKKQKKYHLDF